MPAGFRPLAMHPRTIGVIAINTVREHVVLDRFIGPVIPMETKIIETSELIFEVQMFVINALAIIDTEFTHMNGALFFPGKTVISFHAAAQGIFVTTGPWIMHKRYQVKSKFHRFIKMDAVYP